MVICRNGTLSNRIAVVCSARSSHTKSEGTTNRLLRAAKAAEKGPQGTAEYISTVQQILADHIAAAQKTIKSPQLLESYTEQVQAECAGLIKVLESASHLEEVSRKAENTVISKGEKLACRYMTTLLEDRGIAAQFVDLSDVIKQYGIPELKDDAAYRKLAAALGKEVLACGNNVPVSIYPPRLDEKRE
jgi:aspartate kinase